MPRDVLAEVAALKKKHKPAAMRAFRRGNFSAPSTVTTDNLSNHIGGDGGFKRDAMAHRWKRGREESAETVREIEAKKTRIAPAFNKGAYQYLTPETDAKFIGRK